MQKTFSPHGGSYTKDAFQPYNPVPKKIKELTDKAKALYEEFLEMKSRMDMKRLKLQERKLLALVDHELKHFFGKPYENNYYTGKVKAFFLCLLRSPISLLGLTLSREFWSD